MFGLIFWIATQRYFEFLPGHMLHIEYGYAVIGENKHIGWDAYQLKALVNHYRCVKRF